MHRPALTAYVIVAIFYIAQNLSWTAVAALTWWRIWTLTLVAELRPIFALVACHATYLSTSSRSPRMKNGLLSQRANSSKFPNKKIPWIEIFLILYVKFKRSYKKFPSSILIIVSTCIYQLLCERRFVYAWILSERCIIYTAFRVQQIHKCWTKKKKKLALFPSPSY